MGRGDMSISAFSRRSLLSIKALRLYDDMGLLRPERVDPASGYRYYSAGQLDNGDLWLASAVVEGGKSATPVNEKSSQPVAPTP